MGPELSNKKNHQVHTVADTVDFQEQEREKVASDQYTISTTEIEKRILWFPLPLLLNFQSETQRCAFFFWYHLYNMKNQVSSTLTFKTNLPAFSLFQDFKMKLWILSYFLRISNFFSTVISSS